MAGIDNGGGRSSSPSDTSVIRFNEAAGDCGFQIPDDSTQITIKPSPVGQTLPESKLKIRSLVDYTWDVNYSTGRMMSVHLTGKYIAYIVKVPNSGGVRILDMQTNDRVLIKGSKGPIVDVEFMHKLDDLIVAFIDNYGTVYIYKIIKDPTSKLMQTLLILEVSVPAPVKLNTGRFIWCKYVPEDITLNFTPRDGSYHFAVIHDKKVYVANLCQLIEGYSEGHHTWGDFNNHFMEIDAHSDDVLDASFAPDGTALATASQDGTAKFFQVYLIGDEANEPARCLYTWSPHNGQPVTGLFFLDDHSITSNNPAMLYWKYLLTTGPDMRELKLWTCKEWTCLQTIRFDCPTPSQLKMDLNISAKFLVVSDINRKSMFIVSLVNDEETARFEWISEFSLPCCMLSFNINKARTMTLREIEAAGYEDYIVNEEMSPTEEFCILDIFYVQPKSLQQGNIAFPPPISISHSGTRGLGGRITFQEAPVEVEYIEETGGDASESSSRSSSDDEPAPQPQHRSPPAQASVKPMNLDGRTTSPAPVPQPSTSVLSQQLSSLLLTSGPSAKPASFSNGVQATTLSSERARSLPPIGVLTSPQNIQDHAQQAIPEARVRGSSKNSSSQASSSPSREVEEILSPKTTEQQLHKSDIQNMDEILAVAANNFDIEGNLVSGAYNSNYNNPKPLDYSPNVTCDVTSSELPPQVLQQVNSIMELMHDQAREMRELKREINRLNSAQQTSSRQLDEAAMTRILENYFSQNSSQVDRLEDCIRSVHALEKHRGSTSQALPSNFAEGLTNNIGRLLKNQMETTVLPSILTLFEPVRTQVQAELVKMVLNAETRIKQELKQAIQSPEFKNSLTTELETSIRQSCEMMIPRVLLTSIVPNFEKSLQSLYVKINDTFLKGTKEYIGGLQGTLESRRAHEAASQEELKDHLSSMQDQISSVLQVELESQMLRVLKSLQSTLVRQVEETMVHELNKAFRDQQRFLESSIVSRSVTPALSVSDHGAGSSASTPLDPEALMKEMFKKVERKDYVGAFVQASHYSDISYMMRLAKEVNPNLVFTSKLPTQTHVAIIQQMAADLMTDTERKITYLNVAISTLNTSDRKTLKSVARIVPVFQTAIRKLAETSPGNQYLQPLRILEMAFVGMCAQYSSPSALP